MKSDLELLDRRAVCSLFGGIHSATLYRHVRTGLVPRPVKVGALSRWLRAECEAALTTMVAGRVS
jgi:predicted DNA-binding transcriptional regulator AlpA